MRYHAHFIREHSVHEWRLIVYTVRSPCSYPAHVEPERCPHSVAVREPKCAYRPLVYTHAKHETADTLESAPPQY